MCKNVTSVPGQPLLIADPRGNTLSQGDWTWVRTSVFLKWTNCHDSTVTTVTLVVFSAPLKLRERFSRLWDPDLGHILTDPFSLFAICLDELWLQAQGIYDTVRRVFGDMERVRQQIQSYLQEKVIEKPRIPSTLRCKQIMLAGIMTSLVSTTLQNTSFSSKRVPRLVYPWQNA